MNGIEIHLLSPRWAKPLAEFFAALASEGADRQFHPHPLTSEEAERRCQYSGKDLYYVAVEQQRVLGYGMLRGWDEGYETPSLGIAIHPQARGRGLGRALMQFLHHVARRRGASRVRLKVYSENQKAIALYESLGYRFAAAEDNQRIGTVNLA
jgi:[ribosomal protein S18]-alanine N-acetyltransferase